MKSVKPHQVTLVPDAPDAITSNAGWNTIEYKSLLQDVIADLKSEGIRTSIFVDARAKFIEGALETQTDRVELYTESYACQYEIDKLAAIQFYKSSSELAHSLGMGVNAGHDLNLQNLAYFVSNVPFLDEVSIGHALISDALYMGLEKTIKAYKNCCK